ncbi:nuclear transport factor 2 family protein [Myceligenerans xiligouense]|uniref:SnoaL-like protein n=1 Tax=Myceligenerans xiligouense TaxID=253184 RepID=A0A3N4ZLV4_9MICO|nr:nuclear transport factor 2 family protein [Myceligenerans xiligouense]RPF21895.1 SnoaL-like protein [Myceligenerans xiligouense]
MTAHVTNTLVSSFVDSVNRRDVDGVVALFDDRSVVVDDAAEHRGRDQIRRWIEEQLVTPRITIAVTDFESSGSAARMTADSDGDFPGAPLPFRYRFALGEAINRLEVDLAR